MNQEKIWDYYQLKADEHAGVFAPDHDRYRHLSDRIPVAASVLNVGVGQGGLERRLLAKGCEVFCLDPSAGAIARLREAYALGDHAQVGYAQDMPFADARFDIVVLSEVLEHLVDEVLERTLAEVARVLKPGGRFIGTVPADEQLADSECVCPDCGNRFHRWGHVQSFSHARLQALLAQRFAEVRVRRRCFGNSARLNWKGRTVRLLKRASLRLGIQGSNDSFAFAGKLR